MKMLLAVACGGALGAVGRYLASGRIERWLGGWLGSDFPFGILVVNVVGSFLMGALVELLAHTWSPPPEVRAFLAVGLLGAFTTFSSFSLEVALLYERGALGQAALYIAASVVLSIGGLFAGMALFRALLA